MATCRENFTFTWPLGGWGGAVNPSGQPGRFFPVFFMNPSLKSPEEYKAISKDMEKELPMEPLNLNTWTLLKQSNNCPHWKLVVNKNETLPSVSQQLWSYCVKVTSSKRLRASQHHCQTWTPPLWLMNRGVCLRIYPLRTLPTYSMP